MINKSDALVGTISDGDIRRGLLRGLDMNSPIDSIIQYEALLASPDMKRQEVMELMESNKIKQVPIVDENRRIIGIHLWDDLSTPVSRPNQMIIMAGGMGKRLLPKTENLPKPMLLIDKKPMLEHIISG